VLSSAQGQDVETEHGSKTEPWAPRAGAFVRRHTGGRIETIRAEAKRRRPRANLIVVLSSASVLLLAVVFHALLTR
jgi:hypothetical protein